MWKNFLVAVLVGILPSWSNLVLAQQILIQCPNPAIYAPTADASIYFYWNADSAATGQTPQKGVGTITIGASNVSVTGSGPMTGNSVGIRSGNAGGKITISTGVGTGTNFDYNKGSAGFYMCIVSTQLGRPIWGSNTNPQFKLSHVSGQGLFFSYMNVSTGPLTGTNTPGTTVYLQLAWDSTGVSGFNARARIDNGAWISTGGAVGAVTSSATIQFEGFDGNFVRANYDQVLFSSDSLKDLYSIRDKTAF